MADCAKVFTTFGRLMFLLLMIAQCLLFASFPAKYLDNSAWYAFLVFIAPALGTSWWWINTSEKKMIQIFCIWSSYTWLGLVPMIGIVFGLTADKLDTSQQFSPMVLKLSLGITPLLVMLLLHSEAFPPDQRKMLSDVSFWMVIDVFDSNELLRMVIDENTQSFGIPRSFVKALLAFACIGLLFSPLEMVGKLVKENEASYKRHSSKIQACLNLIVLGLRLGILKYRWDASMFIPKNIIMIALECVSMHRDEEVEGDARQEEYRY